MPTEQTPGLLALVERWEEMARLVEHHTLRVALAALILLLIFFVLRRWRTHRPDRQHDFQDSLS